MRLGISGIEYDETMEGEEIDSILIKKGLFSPRESLLINLTGGRKLEFKSNSSSPIKCSMNFEKPRQVKIELPAKRRIMDGIIHLSPIKRSILAEQYRLVNKDFEILRLMKIEKFSTWESMGMLGLDNSITIDGTVDFSRNGIGTIYISSRELSGIQSMTVDFYLM